MSKELEAFVRLEQNSKRYKGRKQDLDIVFATLKEKENIEKTINELFSENGKVITTIDIKKKLKALKIIKKYIPYYIEIETDENGKFIMTDHEHLVQDELTQEEYDLLNEVLL